MRHILTAFILLFLTEMAELLAQKQYINGYIISLKGDTISGFIEKGNWEVSPQKINFSASGKDNGTWMTPSDILGFGFEQASFTSAKFMIETSPTSLQMLERNPKLHLLKVDGFLENLITGEKNLYSIIDDSRKAHFYIHTDSGFVLLTYKKYIRSVNDGMYEREIVTEQNGYIGQLYAYFSDNPDALNMIKGVTYSKKSLEDLFIAYHSKISKNIESRAKTRIKKPEFGLLAGITLTFVDYKSHEFKYLTGDFNPSLNFTAGTAFVLPLSGGQARLNYVNNLMYCQYGFTGNYEEYESAEQYRLYDIEMRFSYVKMANLIRYNIPYRHFSLFGNAGLTVRVLMDEYNVANVFIKNFETERNEKVRAIKDTRFYEVGVTLGLGGSIKRISAEIRYERGSGADSHDSLKSPTNWFYCIIGYKLL